MRNKKYTGPQTFLDRRGSEELKRLFPDSFGGDLKSANAMLQLSPLFLKLIAYVDRRHLARDQLYFRLVSEIAELLPDGEIAFLARYFVPPVVPRPKIAPRRVRVAASRPTKRAVHASGA